MLIAVSITNMAYLKKTTLLNFVNLMGTYY